MKKNNLKLENFNGPLELLLELIESRELEITDISLIAITDDFLNLIEENRSKLKDLSEILFITAHLIFLKSKALLPVIEEKEAQEQLDLEELKQRLSTYRDFKNSTNWLQKVIESNYYGRSRSFNLEKKTRKLKLTGRLNCDLLATILKRIDDKNLRSSQSCDKVKIFHQKQIELRTISIKERIFVLKNFLKKQKEFYWNDYINNEDKATIIGDFLALTELLKSRKIVVEQRGLFDNILIKAV